MSANKPASGLGRGLQALLGEAAVPSAPSDASAPRPGGVREIEIGRIRPNPEQPRAQFREEAIDELADSIAERGVLQPILLRPHADGFEIVAGERRWRAAQRARLHTIPALVREIDDSTAAEIALIENIQRQDLNAIEEAQAYKRLVDEFSHTQEELARIVHKSRSHVANLLRLLDLPAKVQIMVGAGELSMGHARALITAADPEGLAEEVVRRGLSVRETEQLARGDKPTRQRPLPIGYRGANADISALERQLGDLLGLKVGIKHSPKGGSVTLAYSSLDQLDMICQRLSGDKF